MFRHLNSKHSKETTDDFTLNKRIDQSIRYFKVSAMKSKEDVLNILLDRISEEQTPVYTINRTNTRTIYYTLSSVAAAGLILIVLYFSLAFQTFTGIENQANVFFLPDNSRVVLAEGAQMKYSKLFYNKQVKVKGEAYFEIEDGEGFTVKTNQGQVLVLGTRFNVYNMPEIFKIDCYDGIVGVDYKAHKVKIKAGMQFYGKNGEFTIFENNDRGYPAYAYFDFNCENRKLNKIWPEIEYFFGVKIIDESQGNNAFTGSIHTGNVHEVIDIIATSMKLDFEITDNKQIFIR